MAIDNILKNLRKKRGLSMPKVALALEIPKGTYASYEYGQREPGIEMINRIATFYQVSTDYLLGRPGAKPPESPIDEFAKAERLKDLEEIIIREYLTLEDSEREAVLEFVRNCVRQEEERKSAQRLITVQRAAREDPNGGPVVQSIEVTADEVQRDMAKPLEDREL